MNSYGVENIIRLSVAFTAVGAGTAIDPTAVTLIVRAPDQTEQTYTFAAGEIVRDGAGLYHYDLEITQSGYYNYRYEGTGNLIASANGQFGSKPSLLGP